MSQLSHAQFPLRRHPNLLVDHRRSRSAAVAEPRGANGEAVTGSGGRLHFGMVAGIKSERWPTSNRNAWPECVGIRTRLPFLAYLGLRVLLYAGVVLLVSAVMNWLLTRDGLVINMSRADIVASIVISVCTILLFGINDLLGPGVLFAFVAGRYYYPRLEERAFLFIDMRSSTAIAESLGEERFLDF